MSDKYSLAAVWLTDKYIIIMLLVFPLFVGFQGYVSITLSKYLFFVILSSVWIIASTILWVLSKHRRRLRYWEIIALCFAIWSVFSTIASPFAAITIIGASRYDGLLSIILYIAIFLGVCRFGSWRKQYVWLMAAALTVCCVISLLQLLGFSIFYPNSYSYYDAGIKYVSKFLGTIGNTNLFAAYLCLVVPLLAATFVLSEKGGGALLIPSALGVFFMVASESSGGMLALVVCALCAALLFARLGVLPRAFQALGILTIGVSAAGVFLCKPAIAFGAAVSIFVLFFLGWLIGKYIDDSLHMRMSGIMIGVVVIVLFLVTFFWQGSEGTMHEASSLLHGKLQDGFGSSRILIWRETLAIVPDRLIFGGGPGTLSLRLDLTFSRYFEKLGQTLTSFTDNAHNVYLGYLVNIGLPGMTLYLALIAVTLRKIILSSDKRIIALGCALICAWIEGFFGLGLCLVAPIMWILWGLLYAPPNETGKILVGDTYDEEEKADDYICCDYRHADIVFCYEQTACEKAGGSAGSACSGIANSIVGTQFQADSRT